MAGAVSESDSEEELKEEEAWTAVRTRNKCDPESVPALQTTENKSNRKLPQGASEEVGQRQPADALCHYFLQNNRNNKTG